MKEERLLNKKEVCQWLGIAPSTLDVLLAKKKIRVVKFNRRVLFDPDDVREFIKANKQGGQES